MDSNTRSSSYSQLEETAKIQSNIVSTAQSSSSLPLSLSDDQKPTSDHSKLWKSSCSSMGSKTTSSHRLVQNCGPDCMITQHIVDRLLSRMQRLENERSELLAANRSWAIQFQMMQESHRRKMKSLEEEIKKIKEKHEEQERSKTEKSEPKENHKQSMESKDQLSLLSHQAEVYREDFMEERKARVRAHAQIETLRNELKRERKSRAKLSAYVQQTKVCEPPPAVVI